MHKYRKQFVLCLAAACLYKYNNTIIYSIYFFTDCFSTDRLIILFSQCQKIVTN